LSELPLILVIEDEYTLQSFVEDALTEAGFATEIFSSWEEALTYQGGGKYRAVLTDINLKGTLTGWERRAATEGARAHFARHLHDRRRG
jgi:DNA-binding response OmpR family regulator